MGPDEQLTLIDWEHQTSMGLIPIEFIRLLFDTWAESTALRRTYRAAVLERTTEVIAEGLSNLGVHPADHAHLGALFVADQARRAGGRKEVIRHLCQAYHEGVLT